MTPTVSGPGKFELSQGTHDAPFPFITDLCDRVRGIGLLNFLAPDEQTFTFNFQNYPI